MIGREREMAEANGFLAEAEQRSCGLLLAGEPGIGKTTIWSAVVDEAVSRGFGVLVARPSEAEAELAFAVLTDLFASVEDATLAELPGAQRAVLDQALRRGETERSADPVAVALGALGALRHVSASFPPIVAIDDLQWVDAPSLRALTYAFRRLEGAPVGLVGTVRVGFELELTRLAERDGNSLDRIEVGGLVKRHLAQLVFERTGRALTPPQLQRLAQLSGGSPYYALELAASGGSEAGVPETLSVALRARLANLSESARAVGPRGPEAQGREEHDPDEVLEGCEREGHVQDRPEDERAPDHGDAQRDGGREVATRGRRVADQKTCRGGRTPPALRGASRRPERQ